METVKIYAAVALASIRSQMQHRASFIMRTIGNYVAAYADIAGIWVLFSSFGALGGWTLAEIAVLTGMMNTAFAIAEGIGRGFDMFDRCIKQGDFDRVLLRPQSTAMQVLACELEVSRVGRLLQGVLMLTLGISAQPQPMGAAGYALIIASILGGVMLFMGLLLMQATLCFWTVESLEIFNVFTYGGLTMAAYPLDIYASWFRRFFLYVLPLGFINYLPSAMLFGKNLPYPAFTAYLAPVMGLAFLGLGMLAWRVGVRRYRSVGA